MSSKGQAPASSSSSPASTPIASVERPFPPRVACDPLLFTRQTAHRTAVCERSVTSGDERIREMMFRQDFERDVAGFEVCVCALGIRYTVPKCCVFCHAQNTPPVWRGSSSSSVTREVDIDSGGEDRTSNVRERCSGSPERRDLSTRAQAHSKRTASALQGTFRIQHSHFSTFSTFSERGMWVG